MAMSSQDSIPKQIPHRFVLIIIHRICYAFSRALRFWPNRHRPISNIVRRLLPPLNSPIFCPTIYGFDLCLGKNGGHWVYYLGFYEAGTLYVIRNCLKAGDVFIDVGSSIGLMTNVGSIAVGQHGRVFSFEPDPERFACLTRGLQHNNRFNVRAYQYALGSEKCTVPLYNDRWSPSLVPGDRPRTRCNVTVELLDSILHIEGISRVHFIKIDVEGMEHDVLIGAKNILSGPYPPIICLELNTTLPRANGTVNDVIAFLLKCNSFLLYQMRRSSHTVSKLRIIDFPSKTHPNDNVYCITPTRRRVLPDRLFED